MSIHLILGGAASGKSVFAENIAMSSPQSVVYIATAPHLEDLVWEKKIAKHQSRRPSHWPTVEAPSQLAEAINLQQTQDVLLLVDCVSLWLSNLLLAQHQLDTSIAGLCQTLKDSSLNIILVSNEVGMGIVPEYALSREFREAQGQLNQQLAQLADCVDMVIAGLPWRLKGESTHASIHPCSD